MPAAENLKVIVAALEDLKIGVRIVDRKPVLIRPVDMSDAIFREHSADLLPWIRDHQSLIVDHYSGTLGNRKDWKAERLERIEVVTGFAVEHGATISWSGAWYDKLELGTLATGNSIPKHATYIKADCCYQLWVYLPWSSPPVYKNKKKIREWVTPLDWNPPPNWHKPKGWQPNKSHVRHYNPWDTRKDLVVRKLPD